MGETNVKRIARAVAHRVRAMSFVEIVQHRQEQVFDLDCELGDSAPQVLEDLVRPSLESSGDRIRN
jgi:hypothetical protein